MLVDIITALICYILIDEYKKEKKKHYMNTIKKIGGYEINLVRNLYEIWENCEIKSG